MQIKKRWTMVLILGVFLIGCGGGSGGKNSSFDTSGNSPSIGNVVMLDENSTTREIENNSTQIENSLYYVEENETDIVAYVKENIEKAFKVKGKDQSKITYMLSGGDSIMCRIDPIDGVLSFYEKTDYEKKSIYNFNVVLDDPFNRTIKRVTIYVRDEKNENVIVAIDENSTISLDDESKYFITKWRVNSENGYKLTIPTLGDGYNYSVDWGDGRSSKQVTARISHTYESEGIYTVKIVGDFPRIQVNNLYAEWSDGHIEIKPDSDNINSKLLSVEQWGDIKWKSMRFAFANTELAINASDSPDLSNVTDMTGMFYLVRNENNNAPYLNISSWDTSNIENMSYMFNYSYFTGDISKWDTSHVKDMNNMFATSTFNNDISNWNVSQVKDMSVMFGVMTVFNQDIANWDVSNVKDMSEMFELSHFNKDISNWDVSSVTNMSAMFADNTFNQNISKWDVSSVTNMSAMFTGNRSFNQNINGWDVSNVTDMSAMFMENYTFKQDLNRWDVSKVTNMSGMFGSYKYGGCFNGNIIDWDVSSVIDMTGMFKLNYCFNQNISGWNVANVKNMGEMFMGGREPIPFNQDLNSWTVLADTNTSDMFSFSSVDPLPLWYKE